MKQLIEDLISAMEYHVEQTRPIHSTTVALQAAKEALKAQPAPEQQQPVAVVEIAVSPRRSIVVTHIPGTPFPRVGDFVYIKPERGTPT